jgi:hypothetical protein
LVDGEDVFRTGDVAGVEDKGDIYLPCVGGLVALGAQVVGEFGFGSVFREDGGEVVAPGVRAGFKLFGLATQDVDEFVGSDVTDIFTEFLL